MIREDGVINYRLIEEYLQQVAQEGGDFHSLSKDLVENFKVVVSSVVSEINQESSENLEEMTTFNKLKGEVQITEKYCRICKMPLVIKDVKESLVKCPHCKGMNHITEAVTPEKEALKKSIIKKIKVTIKKMEKQLDEELEYELAVNDDGIEFRYDGYLTFQYDEFSPIEPITEYEWYFVTPSIIQIYI